MSANLRDLAVSIGLQGNALAALAEVNKRMDTVAANALGFGTKIANIGPQVSTTSGLILPASARIGQSFEVAGTKAFELAQATASVGESAQVAGSQTGVLSQETLSAGEAAVSLTRETVKVGEAAQQAGRRGQEGFRSWKQELFGNMEALEKTSAALGKVQWIVAGAFGAGALVARKSVKGFAGFEAQMDRVRALSGATVQEQKTLTQTALQLGAKTEFSAMQAAQGMATLAMAGFKVQESIAAMPGILDAAAAGKVGIETAAEVITDVLRAFGQDAGRAGWAADVLAGTFTSSKTSFESLAGTFRYAAPAAAELGFRLEDVAAAAAGLGEKGIRGEMAGTQLRTIMTRLVNPVGKSSKMLKQWGISIMDSSGKTKPFYQVIDELRVATQGMTKDQRTAAMATIFGREAMTGALALISTAPGKLKAMTDQLDKSGGTARKIADIQRDNLAGALEEMGGSIETAAFLVGGTLAPAISVGAKAITILNNLFIAMPRPLQMVIGGALGLGTATLGLAAAAIFGFRKYVDLKRLVTDMPALLGLATKAQGLLTAATEKFGWMAKFSLGEWALLAGIIALTVLAVQDFVVWAKGGESLFGTMGAGAKILTVGITGLAAGLGIAAIAAGGFSAALWTCPVTWIVAGVIALGAGIVALVRNWDSVKAKVSEVWGSLKSFGSNLATEAIEWGTNLFQGLWQGVSKLPGMLHDSLKKIPGIGKLLGWGESAGKAIAGLFPGGAKQPSAYPNGLAVSQSFAQGVNAGKSAVDAAMWGMTGNVNAFLPHSPAKKGPLSDLDETGPSLVDTLARGIVGRKRVVAAAMSALFAVTTPSLPAVAAPELPAVSPLRADTGLMSAPMTVMPAVSPLQVGIQTAPVPTPMMPAVPPLQVGTQTAPVPTPMMPAVSPLQVGTQTAPVPTPMMPAVPPLQVGTQTAPVPTPMMPDIRLGAAVDPVALPRMPVMPSLRIGAQVRPFELPELQQVMLPVELQQSQQATYEAVASLLGGTDATQPGMPGTSAGGRLVSVSVPITIEQINVPPEQAGSAEGIGRAVGDQVRREVERVLQQMLSHAWYSSVEEDPEG